MKVCTKCKKSKSLDEFDVYRNICKKCRNKYTVNFHRKQLEDPIYYKQYAEKARINSKNYRKHNKEKINALHRGIHKKRPYLNWTRQEVYKAVKEGKLIRQPCEVCGTTINIHGHHDDYTKPLDVRWLCCLHHKKRHKELKRKIEIKNI